MTREERKQRLARLQELNKRALGVSSFEEPLVCVQTASGGSITLQLLAELRDRKRCICRNSSKRKPGVEFPCLNPKVEEEAL